MKEPLIFSSFGLFLTSFYIIPSQCLLGSSFGSNEGIVPCPPEQTLRNVTPYDLFTYVTHACRYNKERRPELTSGPIRVHVLMYVYYLMAGKTPEFPFHVQLLAQFRWNDTRLKYSHLHKKIDVLIGEKHWLKDVWVPHIFMSNEEDSLTMGHLRKDDLITILPEGEVYFATRLTLKMACSLEIGRFPFDSQVCRLFFEAWRYNSSELTLEWDQGMDRKPKIPPKLRRLSEFTLTKIRAFETEDEYMQPFTAYNYSTLIITFHLIREYGFYLMDYYVPSILLVILSWLSFWLTPDALPPRILLGSTTMLTFMMLTGYGVPKASKFKANDLWFISCTAFIFLSLIEFAFVNAIHRSGSEKVEMKKKSSKYILKSSLTPTMKPKRLGERRTSSCPTSPEIRRHLAPNLPRPKQRTLSEVKEAKFAEGLTEALKQLAKELEQRKIVEEEQKEEKPEVKMFSMTPQEIALWIDEKSRIVFPIAFLVFNFFYWSFLWI